MVACCSCRSPEVVRRSRHTGNLWCWKCSLEVIGQCAPEMSARDLYDDVLVMGAAVFQDFDRAGGDVVCECCGKTYHRHPRLPDPKLAFLTLLCDGRVAKL